MIEYSKMTIEELLERADDLYPNSDDSVHSLHCAEIKLQQLQIKLGERANELTERLLDSNKATREVAEKQFTASVSANNLTRELLESNRRSSDINERNSEALNNATVQLAKSTSGLNRATWILAIFTGIQVILAIANFYLSLQGNHLP